MLENVIKKSSIALASLALIAPLALSSMQAQHVQANASVRTVRVTNRKPTRQEAIKQLRKDIAKMQHLQKKIRNERAYINELRPTKRGHHYYKFAYNKRGYRWATNQIKNNTKSYRMIAKRLVRNAPSYVSSHKYEHGVFDAYGRMFNSKLANNKSYRLGYEKGIRDMSGYQMSSKNAYGYYKNTAKHGVGMPNYVDHFKDLAHANLY